MSTDFSTATMVSQPAAYQHHAYKTSAPYNPPPSGSNTPANSSPTSPRTVTHTKLCGPHAPQIRPQKNPIYVPAALRRTEKPSRQSPPKNDSGVDIQTPTWPFANGLARSNSEGIASPISRIATEDIASIYNDTPLSPVSGPITKNHWMPDSSATVCSADTCQTPFGFFNRRHHCRKCGGIFCWQHSAKQIRLNELALFHPEGDLQRACDRCHSDFMAWEHARRSRSNSEDSGNTPTATPIAAPAVKRPEPNRVGSLATSLQGAWNWSTF